MFSTKIKNEKFAGWILAWILLSEIALGDGAEILSIKFNCHSFIGHQFIQTAWFSTNFWFSNFSCEDISSPSMNHSLMRSFAIKSCLKCPLSIYLDASPMIKLSIAILIFAFLSFLAFRTSESSDALKYIFILICNNWMKLKSLNFDIFKWISNDIKNKLKNKTFCLLERFFFLRNWKNKTCIDTSHLYWKFRNWKYKTYSSQKKKKLEE